MTSGEVRAMPTNSNTPRKEAFHQRRHGQVHVETIPLGWFSSNRRTTVRMDWCTT